jgi:hypothetical protein
LVGALVERKHAAARALWQERFAARIRAGAHGFAIYIPGAAKAFAGEFAELCEVDEWK